MKFTTKIISCCLPFIILLSACNKTSVTTKQSNKSSSATSMAVTLNSTTKLSFNNCFVAEATANGSSQILIDANNITNNAVSDNGFEVDLFGSLDSLKAGQVFPASSSFEQLHSSALNYFVNDSTEYVSQPAQAIGSVTITEVTSAEIKGTFSGNLYGPLDFDGNTLLYTATNGSFTAKRD